MQRYGKEFADRKKTYDKQVKEIAAEIRKYAEGIEETEKLPKIQILRLLQRLGYKKYREADAAMKDDEFLEKYSGLCAQYQETAQQLLQLCNKERIECGWPKRKPRGRRNGKNINYIEKAKRNAVIFVKSWKKPKDRKRNIAKNYRKWTACISVENVQEDIAQLEGKIEAQETEIRNIRQSIEGISKEIEVQKGLKDSLDVVMQEIYSISERYIDLQPDASRCPMCGADHEDRIALAEALKKHKEYEEADNRAFRLLLDSRAEKEQALKDQTNVLQEMTGRMERARKKQRAIVYVRDMLSIDQNTGSEEIEKIAREEQKRLRVRTGHTTSEAWERRTGHISGWQEPVGRQMRQY